MISSFFITLSILAFRALYSWKEAFAFKILPLWLQTKIIHTRSMYDSTQVFKLEKNQSDSLMRTIVWLKSQTCFGLSLPNCGQWGPSSRPFTESTGSRLSTMSIPSWTNRSSTSTTRRKRIQVQGIHQCHQD